MKYTLKRDRYFTKHMSSHYSYESYTARELIETDVTGRWKIVIHDDTPSLYIECFEIVEYEKKKEVQFTKTFERDFGWFGRLLNIPPRQEVIYKTAVIKEPAVKARVEWVHESDLHLTLEYVNTCEYCK